MIVMVTVSPGAYAVITLVGTAFGVGAGSAWPQGALFSGRPWPSCWAQFIGACSTKWARAAAGIETPAAASTNEASLNRVMDDLPYRPSVYPFFHYHRAMAAVTVKDLVVRFDATTILDRVGVEVASGELLMLLGPSGCGKTTLLRSIAGFIEPDAGSIRFDAEEMRGRPTHARNVGMVFQSFALWPHMTVAENVGFGLRERRVPRAEIATRVDEALASTRMAGYGPRAIDELS